jgi:hypothetical protein
MNGMEGDGEFRVEIDDRIRAELELKPHRKASELNWRKVPS